MVFTPIEKSYIKQLDKEFSRLSDVPEGHPVLVLLRRSLGEKEVIKQKTITDKQIIVQDLYPYVNPKPIYLLINKGHNFIKRTADVFGLSYDIDIKLEAKRTVLQGATADKLKREWDLRRVTYEAIKENWVEFVKAVKNGAVPVGREWVLKYLETHTKAETAERFLLDENYIRIIAYEANKHHLVRG